MRLRALSHYDGDKETRFGDCIMLYDAASAVVYDCGHEKHAKEIEGLLKSKPSVRNVDIVVSHNDSDHTSGVCSLLKWLHEQSRYTVRVFTHQYLKHLDAIFDKINDKRRTEESVAEALLAEFDNIAEIIETAQNLGFSAEEALADTAAGNCTIVGPSVDEFTDTAAKAVDNRVGDSIGEGDAEETVMNAASIQLMCKLENAETILLCGDASPDYLHNLNSCNIIQLPHHGQLESAQAIFGKLKDSYSKKYFISDNTGSATTSGGSDDLVQYMEDELYDSALSTKKDVVNIPPNNNFGVVPVTKPQGVKLGEMDS